ncbi:MAG: tyrosine-type recombinase/integrase [Chloroflexota bacterium]
MKIIEDFLLSQGYSVTTQASYRRLLSDLMTRGIDSLDASGLNTWLNRDTWGPSMRWQAYCAARSFIRWQYGEKHPAMSLKIKRVKSGPQRTLKESQIAMLLASFDTTKVKGLRDLTACCLMLDTGLRLSEMCRLQVDYLDLPERALSVLIKGGGWDDRVYSLYTSTLLRQWLGLRAELAQCKEVFISLAGKRKGLGLTRDGFRVTVRRWGPAAGIGPITPHDFRRTFATQSVRNGAPTRIVQVAGGWSNVEMVERYTRALAADDCEPWLPVARIMSA